MRPLVFHRYPLSSLAVQSLLLLLILPAIAATRIAAHIPWYLAPAAMCLASIWAYRTLAYDKKRAQTNQWRVPESTLHFLELIGGWPGSFIAQRRFRHKTSKQSYQFSFWMIAVVYQLVAFDYINNWKYLSSIVALVSTIRDR